MWSSQKQSRSNLDNALLFTPDQATLPCILKVITSTPLQGSEMQADTAALDIMVGTAGPSHTVLRAAGRNGARGVGEAAAAACVHH